MKRKKAPVVLIAFLVILLGTAFGINAIQSGAFQAQGDQNADRMAPAAPETAAELKERMKGKLGASPVVATPVDDGSKKQAAAAKAPPKPTPKVETPQKYVPKPSDTQTGSGWYTDEGRK